MMRSMFSGVSGLRVHQTRMDVIANNISNVNTVGFKASRASFADMFYQTLQSASGPNPAAGRGGVNPMQIGLGVNVAAIDSIMTTGGAQRTDYATHVMIQGDNGFFIVGDSSGTFYTRAGNFRWDEWNQLTTFNGLMVQGWRAAETQPAGAATTVFERAALVPVALTGDDIIAPPERTTNVRVDQNVRRSDADLSTGTGIEFSIPFFDSLGNKFLIDMQKTWNAADGWVLAIGDLMHPVDGGLPFQITAEIGAAVNTDGVDPGTELYARAGGMPFNLTVTVGARVVVPPGAAVPRSNFAAQNAAGANITDLITFTETGRIDSSEFTGFMMNVVTGPGFVPVSVFGDADGMVAINFSDVTQFPNVATSIMGDARDGANAGNLISLSIGPDGIVRGAYDNDTIRELFMIPLASFANPSGLSRVGNNMFAVTANSGAARVAEAQTGGRSLLGGVLEMSNVDLSNEFTEMITTQRGFQANSRIITVSDDMLAELVNLKR